MTKYYGRKIIVNNTPFDRWCRSGNCKVGKRSQQIVQARRTRAEAKSGTPQINVTPLDPERKRSRTAPDRSRPPAERPTQVVAS